MPGKKPNASARARPIAVESNSYRELLDDIKARIRVAQVKAHLSVNRELIQLYWDIGALIVIRQRSQGWGKSVVERLATDIQKNFPGMAGFSPQNIWYMRAFYLAWTEEVEILQRVVGESERVILQRTIGETAGLSPPAAVAQIPWGQNIELITKLKSPLQHLPVRAADDREWLVQSHVGALDRIRSVFSARQGNNQLQECPDTDSV